MGFRVLPTNIGGVSLNSIASPLAALLSNPSAQVMTFPSDLGSNPAMGHAVIIQAYDYKTGLGESIFSLANGASLSNLTAGIQSAAATVASGVGSAINSLSNGNFTGAGSALFSAGESLGESLLNSSVGQVFSNSITAGQYTPLTQGPPLATISLFMPEQMTISYSAQWDDVSMTKELALIGIGAAAISDINKQGMEGVTPYAKALLGKTIGGNLGGIVSQSLGVFTNPQTQLLYKGSNLRQFTLAFTLTPKTSAEAQTVKNICDSFAYFSLPGIAGAQVGNSGQFLTPPQVFKVQFQFLGGTGISSQISNAISSVLNNTGLNVLTGTAGTITGGKPSKTFTVNDCVLENVDIDYSPNGWATYNDGYPVQTTISLSFKETTIYTKQNMKNTAVASNYDNAQYAGSDIDSEVASLGGTREDFMTGSNGFGNYGEG
jgi:hypothetical protein